MTGKYQLKERKLEKEIRKQYLGVESLGYSNKVIPKEIFSEIAKGYNHCEKAQEYLEKGKINAAEQHANRSLEIYEKLNKRLVKKCGDMYRKGYDSIPTKKKIVTKYRRSLGTIVELERTILKTKQLINDEREIRDLTKELSEKYNIKITPELEGAIRQVYGRVFIKKRTNREDIIEVEKEINKQYQKRKFVPNSIIKTIKEKGVERRIGEGIETIARFLSDHDERTPELCNELRHHLKEVKDKDKRKLYKSLLDKAKKAYSPLETANERDNSKHKNTLKILAGFLQEDGRYSISDMYWSGNQPVVETIPFSEYVETSKNAFEKLRKEIEEGVKKEETREEKTK